MQKRRAARAEVFRHADSLQFSQEIVGLALDQISKIFAAELAEERQSWANVIDRFKVLVAALLGFGFGWIIF